ncbi:adenosylcobinamide-GDP ribazoletransferase [Sulfitobacter sp. HNIBRBA3233]|uniref:adenosylcobinamide-GDP ribazoletransferase n=1 Tax=Sulfitobacter marinivivus TaxID=3158558 RepID=UPI0032DE3973
MKQLWLALVLLTRLPMPHLPAEAFANGARAVWAYPVVGVVVGSFAALCALAAAALGLPDVAVSGAAIAGMMMVTGAMHEDGLADLFDGFWGAVTTPDRLRIMRDSQIGTYGVLALVVVTGLRWSALTLLLAEGIGTMIAAAVLSRAVMPLLMATLPHARDDGLSHSVGRPAMASALVALGIGSVLAIAILGSAGILAALTVIAVGAGLGTLARRKIGGQTGDVLGAAQQLAELAVLLLCAAAVA